MDTFVVKITDEALKDMEEIYNYIAYKLLSPDIALEQYNRIANKILQLDTFPEKYELFEIEPEHSLGLHKMVVDNFVVCYIVEVGIVTVTDVLYAASDVHNKLNKRHLD